MEANKENICSKPTRNMSRTRIPVPVQPLPLLPKHLIVKTANQARAPLQTLDFSNADVASTSSQAQKIQEGMKIQKSSLKSCDRPVIENSRIKNYWGQKVFKDNEISTANSGNVSVKSEPKDYEDISTTSEPKEVVFAESGQNYFLGESSFDLANILSEDENEEIETVVNTEDKQKNMCVVKSDIMVVTPHLMVHKAIRNIKKSLKRPSSRELQGISPAVDKQTSENSAKRRLVFDHSEDRLLASYVLKETYMSCLSRDYTTDIFSYLRLVETKPRCTPYISSVARACIVNWFLRLNGADGNPGVVQSACWYLDSFLAKKYVPVEKVQVTAAACYWIAQKLNGRVFSASKMVVYGNKAFTDISLRAVEMKVLLTLRFPRQPVVPQEFITYLSWLCNQCPSQEIEMAASFLCMAGILVDKSLCQEYPSVIGAAAVKTAVQLLGTKHLMEHLFMCPEFQACVLKFSNLSVASVLRRAILVLASSTYEYDVLMQYYSSPPYYVAQKLVDAARRLNEQ